LVENADRTVGKSLKLDVISLPLQGIKLVRSARMSDARIPTMKRNHFVTNGRLLCYLRDFIASPIGVINL